MVSPTQSSFFSTSSSSSDPQQPPPPPPPLPYMSTAFNLPPTQLVAAPLDPSPPIPAYMPLDAFSPLAPISTPGPSPPVSVVPAFDVNTPSALTHADLGSPPADVKVLVTTHCDSIVQAAHSCRQSFVDRSDPLDAQDWLDQMRSALDLVEKLITPEVEAMSAKIPTLPRIKREHTDLLHPISRHPSPPFDALGHADSASRKRCASTLDEDRAPKMIKLEPSPPLSQITILPNGFPVAVTASSVGPASGLVPAGSLVPAPSLVSASSLISASSIPAASIVPAAGIVPAATIAPAASLIPPIASLPLHSIPPPLALSSLPETSESNVVTPTNPTIPLPFPPSAGSTTSTFPVGVRASRSSSTASLHMPPSLYPSGPASAHPLSSSEEYKYYSAPHSPEPQDDDSDDDDEPAPVKPSRGTRGNSHRRGYSDSNLNSANEVPAELRPEVDRIFFEFLNRICSNLDSTDAKGELIHQTLMAKKMQRLDESPDYRPFKFRIQAFTNAFLEELARQGYPEDKIPMKKIRHYLWNQPHISRFNEDGKKTKSKGNHIWNIEARKSPSLNERGQPKWSFRQFSPKISGTPPSIAYVGLRWSWTPKVWDPQAARQSMDVEWRTVKTLSWLVLEEGLLHGIPTPASESGDVTIAAVFMQEGREVQLTHSFHLTVAPMSGTAESSYTAKSRRPSLAADGAASRRGVSDSAVPSISAQRPTAGRIAAAQAQAAAVAAGGHVSPPGDQVMQVVKQAAKRVTNAVAHSVQVVISEHSHDPSSPQSQNAEAQAMSLMKQQQVLTTTAKAFNEEALIAGGAAVLDSSLSSVIVAAAQQIVHTAALQVVADNVALAETMQVPATQPTLNEVSVATQSAVAKAVEVTGAKASDVEVLMTASAMIKEQARGSHAIAALANSGVVSVAAVAAGLGTDVIRPHSTGSAHVPIPGPSGFGAPVYMPSSSIPPLASSIQNLPMELDPKSMPSGSSQF